MSAKIDIYIGYDRVETVAYHVLAHSLMSRSSEPLSLIPLNRANLSRHYWRPRGEYDSTDFSNSRWIVPHLQEFDGWAMFMDCDMLCRADIAELWDQRDDRYAVMVKQHDYRPTSSTKFLGNEQHKYNRKNWSSLMLLNCSRLKMLTRHIVNTHSPGLWFHQFAFLPDEEIGAIEGSWNLLANYDEYDADAKLVHFTEGGPWHGVEGHYTDEWREEFADMEKGDNPT